MFMALDTFIDTEQTTERTRRIFATEFKQHLVELCLQPDTSVAKVAMQHQVNANLLHKWIRQCYRQCKNAYQWEILLELPGTAEVVYDLEVAFKTEMQEFHYKPKIAFNGSTTECYTELSQTIQQLIE